MKIFERLVKKTLSVKIHGMLVPMQFAYQINRGVDDDTTTVTYLIFLSILHNNEHLTQYKHTFY